VLLELAGEAGPGGLVVVAELDEDPGGQPLDAGSELPCGGVGDAREVLDALGDDRKGGPCLAGAGVDQGVEAEQFGGAGELADARALALEVADLPTSARTAHGRAERVDRAVDVLDALDGPERGGLGLAEHGPSVAR
jgi:hypothetical protein